MNCGGEIQLQAGDNKPGIKFHALYGIVSHGAQIGGLHFFADHTRKNKFVHDLSTPTRAACYLCLSSRSEGAVEYDAEHICTRS